MLPQRTLIIDANALCYHAYYSTGSLHTRGLSTGVIYGFFLQIATICKALQSSHLIFCWDSRQSLRKRLCDSYKDNRGVKKEANLLEAFTQFSMIQREILPRLGYVNNFSAIGYEADDLIAMLCLNDECEAGSQLVIVSNDQDLYQLLSPRVMMYKPSKRKVYTHVDFQNEFEIEPAQWADVKALAGCQSDNVIGISMIGEKKACAYVRGQNSNSNKLIDSKEGQAIYKRNLPLVKLPLQDTPFIKCHWEDFPSYSEWINVCEEFAFNSFLDNPKDWEQIFTYQIPVDGFEKMKMQRKMKGFLQ